jgi:hypothetical protein
MMSFRTSSTGRIMTNLTVIGSVTLSFFQTLRPLHSLATQVTLENRKLLQERIIAMNEKEQAPPTLPL